MIYGLAFLAILCGLTLLGGYPIVTSPAALLLPVALALTATLFALIGLLYTSLVKVIDLYSYYFTLFMTPLFLFSGIFYPTSRFPHGEAVAWFTPLYHAVRLHRGLAQGPLGLEHAVSAAWMVAVSAGLLAIVPRRYRARMVK
jgi:lipooligosaccharide transport system permease protein